MAATKKSYAIPCSSAFRDRVQALAARRGVNAGDLVRSVMLVVPPEAIAAMADPGEPAEHDRETITLKSGPGAGKPWRRKPRIQVRLPAGHTIPELRRALNLALAMSAGQQTIRVENAAVPAAEKKLQEAQRELDRMRGIIRSLSFSPLRNSVKTRSDALYVLGFPPNAKLSPEAIKTRFRALAAIHHPDSAFGDTRRMSQLNEAMATLRTLGF
ncbi:MAG: J domain-containing protein [Alphaproteobacteria bacterium]